MAGFLTGSLGRGRSGVVRTCGGERRWCFSPYFKPPTGAGVRLVAVDKELREVDARALDSLLSFARDTELQIIEECGAKVYASQPGESTPGPNQAAIALIALERRLL